ncbi:hypothetical protein D5R81_17415 [Parashewanella spongiae]|uniref:Uncharacterized protein n=1 Tax=Parashewanella spongiae TaxID=342950 RepID=A0A3A6T6H8_9GAMM|nr:hypothetical protein [Parashewanella spongiae]MCL1079862.1 hypothetical protein [Parashewanella spongiae]RJY06753.1 hypothetical protein D5R81_17415 [Parashewanella spongiae]
MALTSTSNATSSSMCDSLSISNNAKKTNRKRVSTNNKGNPAPKKLHITTPASKCYLVSKDYQLPEELQLAMNSRGIQVKSAFTKLLSKVEVESETQRAQYSNKLNFFFINIADTKVKDTGFFTSIVNERTIKKFFNFSDEHVVLAAKTQPMKTFSSIFHKCGLPDVSTIKNFNRLLKRLQLQEGDTLNIPLLKSLSSIFNGRGLPSEVEIARFNKLLTLPQLQEGGKLSLPRLKSLSSIYSGRGLPDEASTTRFIELLELPQLQRSGKLSLSLFKSLSSILNGCGLPDETAMRRFIDLLELPQLQEGGTLSLPRFKPLSSMFNGRGLPDEVEMVRFIKLLKLPQLQEDDRLNLPLFKSLSSLFNGRGLPDEVEIVRFIKLLELPQLQEGGRLSLPLFKSLSSIFSGRGLLDEVEMAHFIELLELPQLQEGGRLNLPLFKSLSSMFSRCGQPDEAAMMRFIKLLELPQLQEGGRLSLPLFKSLSSIFSGRGLPDEVEMAHFIKLLELPQLQEGGRLSLPLFKSLSSIFDGRGLPDEKAMVRFLKLLELPQLQEGGRLSLPRLKSLSSIFHGHGLPDAKVMTRFIYLLQLPQLQEAGRLNLPLLKSLSSIFNGCGLPDETAMRRFIELLELPQLQEGGRLNLPLLKSLSSIFDGRGLPDEVALKRFIELLQLPQLQEGGKLNLPVFKSLSSIFHCCGLPNKATMTRFIELLKLPQLQEDGTLNLPLYRLLLVKVMSRPDDADGWFCLLENPALQQNGRIHLISLACVFSIFPLPPKQGEVTHLLSLLSIDGQPDDQLLQLCIQEWKQSSLKAVEKAFSCSPVAKLLTHFCDNDDELTSLKALALAIKGEPEMLMKLRNYCSLSTKKITGLTFPCAIESHQGILSVLGKISFANGQLGLKLFFANAPCPEGNRPMSAKKVSESSRWEGLLSQPLNKTILSSALDLKRQSHESVSHYFRFCRVTRSRPTLEQWDKTLYPVVLKGVEDENVNQVQAYLIAACLLSPTPETKRLINDTNCCGVLCQVFSTANDLYQLSMSLPAKKFYTLCLAGKDYGQYLNTTGKPKVKTMNTLNFGLVTRGLVLPVKHPTTLNAVTFSVSSDSMNTDKGVTLCIDTLAKKTDCPMVLFCYWFSLSFASAPTPYHITQAQMTLLNIDEEVIELPFPQLSQSSPKSITIRNWSADELSLFIDTLSSDFPVEFADSNEQRVVSTYVTRREERLSQKQTSTATINTEVEQESWLNLGIIEKCVQKGLPLNQKVRRNLVYYADSLSTPTVKALVEKYSLADIPSELRERLSSSVQYQNIPLVSWHHDSATTSDTAQEHEPMETSVSQDGEEEAILSLMDGDDFLNTPSVSKDNQPVQLSEFDEEWARSLFVDLPPEANPNPILDKPQLGAEDVEVLLARIEEFTLSELTIMLSKISSDVDSRLVKQLDNAYDIQQKTISLKNVANHEDELSVMDCL